MTAPSDLAALFEQHRLMICPPDALVERPPECACGWAPSGLNAARDHRAHVADAIEAAGWRQVPEAGAATSPNIEALVNLAAEHQNCTGCPTPWWLTRWLTDARMGGSR